MLGEAPALVPDEVVRKFAWESSDHFDRDEYELVWRRLAYRVVQELERLPDAKLTTGLEWARWPGWPEEERTALRALVTEIICRAAEDEKRWGQVNELIVAAAQLDQDLTPWLRLLDSFPDAIVADFAASWSWDYAYDTKPLLSWAWWECADQPIHEWLTSRALRDRLSAMDGAVAQRALENIDLMVEFSTR